jgi:acyl carrier protein
MNADTIFASISSTVRRILRDTHGIDVELAVDEPLLSSGLIDSLNLVSLLNALTEDFGVNIEPLDVTLENFDSMHQLQNFVQEKLVIAEAA